MSEKIDSILNEYRREESSLVPILQEIQAQYNYLPKEVLIEVSDGLGITLSQVYSVATFFKAFTLEPRGRHLINVCLGTACHVRGAARVLDKIERELSISPGETTSDYSFTLDTVNCVGACALGPMVIIDGKYFGQMRTDEVNPTLEKFK